MNQPQWHWRCQSRLLEAETTKRPRRSAAGVWTTSGRGGTKCSVVYRLVRMMWKRRDHAIRRRVKGIQSREVVASTLGKMDAKGLVKEERVGWIGD